MLKDTGVKRQTRLSFFNKIPSASNEKFAAMLDRMERILDYILKRPLTDERHDILALMMRAVDPETGRKMTDR